MIGGKNILKIAKHVSKRSGGSFDLELTHPGREWVVGILVSVCLTFMLGAFAWFTYYSQLRQLDKPVVTDDTLIEYKQEKAREVLQLFGDRERQFESLRAHKNPKPVVEVLPESETEVLPLAGEEVTP